MKTLTEAEALKLTNNKPYKGFCRVYAEDKRLTRIVVNDTPIYGFWVCGFFNQDVSGDFLIKTGYVGASMGDAPMFYTIVPDTFGQYIKQDDFGKPIYVGDIVKVTYMEKRYNTEQKPYISEFELVEQVVYDEKRACFLLRTYFEGIPLDRPFYSDMINETCIKSIEVIGNIFENPELMEGVQK